METSHNAAVDILVPIDRHRGARARTLAHVQTPTCRPIIEAAWDAARDDQPATRGEVRDAVATALDLLDSGEARVAEKIGGSWVVNQWLKKAVLLSFRLNDMEPDRRRAGRGQLVGQGALQVRGHDGRRLQARRASGPCRAPSCGARPTSRPAWF